MDEKIIKLKEEYKQKISRLNDYLWGAGLKDPISRIQQMSFLFFLKMLEEQDIDLEKAAQLTKRIYKSIFEGKNEKYRWSNWLHKTGKELFTFVRDDVFPFMEKLSDGKENIRKMFYRARFLIPDKVTLKRAIEIIDGIDFSQLDADIKGDLYEELLNQIEAAGELGQFLTPRHIIRFIVQMINPKIGETVFDPACGSGGFLLGAYELVKLQNSDKKHIRDYNGAKRGPGDKLSQKQWQFLQNETFFGQDIDLEMARITLMNFFLHGLEESDIKRKDTIAGAEDEEDLRRYDVVMTNPPFAGKVDRERIKKSLPVKSAKTQILFLGYVIEALKQNGRAGIILPEGTLFGTNKDDKEIRRYLLENMQLQAVVSTPAGVFQPYSGVKTSILILKRKLQPKLDEKEKIWFFDMKGDGSSLSKAKKFGSQYQNDIPKLIELWNKNRAVKKPYSWFTPVKEIIENDYILSANTYNPYSGEEEKEYRNPRTILEEIEAGENKLKSKLSKIKKLL
ncbi:type I restriction-modification system subunit M [Patescibacteria group bacterium AH-259-L07]|nr:type I restriction-modification system subunit M [Patescibacteria group bacterium AH-259-L07]